MRRAFTTNRGTPPSEAAWRPAAVTAVDAQPCALLAFGAVGSDHALHCCRACCLLLRGGALVLRWRPGLLTCRAPALRGWAAGGQCAAARRTAAQTRQLHARWGCSKVCAGAAGAEAVRAQPPRRPRADRTGLARMGRHHLWGAARTHIHRHIHQRRVFMTVLLTHSNIPDPFRVVTPAAI